MSDEQEPGLDEILRGEETTAETPPETTAEAAPEPEQTETPPDTGEPSEQEDAAPPAAEETTAKEPAQTVPLDALMDEREKRQELERRLAAAEAEKAPEPPDPEEDPKGWAEHFKAENAAERLQDRIEMSRQLVSMQHEDFAEKEAKFMEMADKQPELAERMLAAPNPAMYAYNTVVNQEKLDRLENAGEYEAEMRQQIEADVRAKLEAEYQAKAEQAATTARATSMPNLAGATAAGGNSVGHKAGEVPQETLDEIIEATRPR